MEAPANPDRRAACCRRNRVPLESSSVQICSAVGSPVDHLGEVVGAGLGAKVRRASCVENVVRLVDGVRHKP